MAEKTQKNPFGAGRKKKPESKRKKAVSVTFSPENRAFLEVKGNMSGYVNDLVTVARLKFEEKENG